MELKRWKELLIFGLFLLVTVTFVSAGDVIVKNGELNVTEDFFAGTDALYIDSANNRVGIGTSSPAQPLDISLAKSGEVRLEIHNEDTTSNSGHATFLLRSGGSAGGDAKLHFVANGVGGSVWNMGMDNNDGDKLKISSGSDAALETDTLFTLTHGGDVGIGDTSPDAFLTVNTGTNDGNAISLKSSDVSHPMTALTEADTYAEFKKDDSAMGGLAIRAFSGSGSETAWTSRVFADTQNTTKSTAAVGTIEFFSGKDNGASVTGLGTDGNLVTFADWSAGTKFIFDVEGSGHADTGWTTFSDERLKSDIATLPYGLNEVLQLEPKIYTKRSGFLEDGNIIFMNNSEMTGQIGLVAQDILPIIPEAISNTNIDTSNSFYSIDYDKVTVILINAVKELERKNAELEARIVALEG